MSGASRRVAIVLLLASCGPRIPCPSADKCWGSCDVTVVDAGPLPVLEDSGEYAMSFCNAACAATCSDVCGTENRCGPGDAGASSLWCNRQCLYK